MLLNRLGYLRRVDAVLGLGITRLAKVVHRQCFPVLLVRRIVDVDVASGANDLIFDLQFRTLGHQTGLGRDRYHLPVLWLLRLVLHLGQARQRLGGENRVARARCRAAIGRPNHGSQFGIKKEIATPADRRVVRLDRDHVFPLDQIPPGGGQIELDKTVLLDRRAGAGAESRLLGGHVADSHMASVHPGVKAIVKLDGQF